MTEIALLAEDVARLRAAYPEADDGQLESLLVEAAVRHRAHEPDPYDMAEVFIHEAAAIAVYRQQLAVAKHRLPDAVARESASYAEQLELDREVIPRLKQEAQRLRAQVRDLEERLRSKGLVPDAIEPQIGAGSIAVDDYEPPRFTNVDERRAATVEFFRRVGGER